MVFIDAHTSHKTKKERKKERNNRSLLYSYVSLLNSSRPNYKVNKSKRKKRNTYTQKTTTDIV